MKRRFLLVALGGLPAVWLLGAVGCRGGAGGPSEHSTEHSFALETVIEGTGSLSDPLRLNPRGPYLVSALPSPDGKWVAASGRLGKGLFVLPADGRGKIRTVDADYRGPRVWTDAPIALNFGHDAVDAWLPGEHRLVQGKPVWRRDWDEELGSRLGQTPYGELYHHPRKGTVTLVSAKGRWTVRGGFRAWGARLAPDRRRVVWCSGSLSKARLFVWDLGADKVSNLGRGVQPDWSRDGRALLFVRPDKLRTFDGYSTVLQSQLLLWTIGKSEARALPLRRGLAPMEPRFGPEAKWVYFSDWKDGALYRARLDGEGRAP